MYEGHYLLTFIYDIIIYWGTGTIVMNTRAKIMLTSPKLEPQNYDPLQIRTQKIDPRL